MFIENPRHSSTTNTWVDGATVCRKILKSHKRRKRKKGDEGKGREWDQRGGKQKEGGKERGEGKAGEGREAANYIYLSALKPRFMSNYTERQRVCMEC